MLEELQKRERLRRVKDYLVFLKDYGYREIPFNIEDAKTLTDTEKTMPPSKHNQFQNNLSEFGPVSQKPFSLTLDQVKEELGDCQRCKLCSGRTHIVFGSGNPKADLVFVGEGPGAEEDTQGLPFVGRAGKKLTEIIEKGMNLNREKDTYICNIVKCRPPNNRDPEKDEISACKPFLIKQIQTIAPKVIVALGKPSASTLLGRNVAITKERGSWHEFEGIPLMLTYHPAYLLRAYTMENRKAVFEDMQQVLEVLNK